jgi:hypothetical protein
MRDSADRTEVKMGRVVLCGVVVLAQASACATDRDKGPGERVIVADASPTSDSGSSIASQDDSSVPHDGAAADGTPDGGGGRSDAGDGSGSAGSSGTADDAGAEGAVGVDSGSGADAGGCRGVAIVPDDSGYVAPNSNSVGIHGSWFVYSDCADLKGTNCARVTSPTGTGFANVGGKMCTAGTTSTATGAWGAGIGLELNDGPPQQPYDTVTHGVVGFCFQLSGTTIPSTSIRVAFPTENNNDNAYFEEISTLGVHTVLFSDTAQGSWVTDKVAFQPTAVMLVQFQIPSSVTAPVPWDFCVEGMTAVMQ